MLKIQQERMTTNGRLPYPICVDEDGMGWLDSPVGTVVEVPDVRAADIP